MFHHCNHAILNILNYHCRCIVTWHLLLLLGGLQLPFDRESVTLITRFICSAVNKVFHLRKEKLRELEAPWLS